MVLNKDINFLLSYFLLVFSSCFIANISKISPVYISLLLIFAFCLAFAYNLSIKRINKNYKFIFVYVCLFVCYIFMQMLFTRSLSNLFDYLLYIISFFYLFLGILFLTGMTSVEVRNVIKNYFYVSNLLLLLDFFYRFLHRDNSYSGILFIYNFKFNGIMFMDSNFSGFVALINFSFAKYLNDRKIVHFTSLKFFLLFFLILINLSRAAILAALFIILYSWFVTRAKKVRLYLFIFAVLFLILLIPFVFSIFVNDDSFGTKLDIFSKTWRYIKEMSFSQFMFGNGIFTSPDFLGLSGHNYISQTIIEFGCIVFILQMLLFLILCIYSSGKSLYIILPYLIAGLSMAPITIPYFYVMNSVILLYEKGEIV